MTLSSIITLINIAEEKEKFFSLPQYNPQFVYNWDIPVIQQWMRTHSFYKNFVEAVLAQDCQKIMS